MVGAWGGSSAAGEILVVFGAATFPAVVGIADLDGSAGFVMLGDTTSDAAGFSLAAAGVSIGGRVGQDFRPYVLLQPRLFLWTPRACSRRDIPARWPTQGWC